MFKFLANKLQRKKGNSLVTGTLKKVLNIVFNTASSIGIKDVPEVKSGKKVIRYNFRLGLMFLKKNKITDAKFRFYLVNKMDPKLALNNYCLAYVYFIENKINKALFFLNKAVDLKGGHFPRAAKLLRKIEMLKKN